MRFVLFSLLALTAFAAEEPKAKAPEKAPTERALSETELLKFKLAVANVALLRKQYDVDKFETEVKQYTSEEDSVIIEACRTVGVLPDGIQKGECGFTAGVGPDGKALLGADGKPVQARVWKNVPEKPKNEAKPEERK